MAGTEFTESERRIRNLEYESVKLKNALASARLAANKAGQDASQVVPVFQGLGNPFFRFQVLSGVTAASGATLGGGTVRLQTVIGGVRYNLTDGTAGHYTDFQLVNDTFSPLVAKTYGICANVDGEMTVLLGTCTASPTFSADDITAPGGG